MFNLTDSPEFIAELRRAILTAAQGLELNAPARVEDPAEVWLTTKEAMQFLRMSSSAFQRFKTAYAAKLRVCLLMPDPRYQLLSLQRIMQEHAKGGEEPELALEPRGDRTPKSYQPAAKQRVVTVRMGTNGHG